MHIPSEVDFNAMSPSPSRFDSDDGGDDFGDAGDDDDGEQSNMEEISLGQSQESQVKPVPVGTAFFPPTPHTPFTPQTPRGASGEILPDPWRQLDAHEDKPSVLRPFRRGKTYRSLMEVQAATVSLATERKSSLRASMFSCFADGYITEQKRRQAFNGDLRANRKRATDAIPATPSLNWNCGIEIEGQEGLDAVCDDDEHGGDSDDGGEDFGDDFGPDVGAAMMDESEVVGGYEDLCKQHVSGFFKDASAYINESDLSKRVGDWQDRMAPVLEQQEARPTFDIQLYGEHILDQFEKIGREVDEESIDGGGKLVCLSFREMVSQGSAFEVCRTFLASLQLAADGNVRIFTEAGPGTISEDIQLTCLNSEARRPTNIMDNDQAETENAAKVLMPKARRKTMRFAVGSPMVCDTYAPDEYDRAYAKMPSPAPSALLFQDDIPEVPASIPPPPSPVVSQMHKRARRAVGSKEDKVVDVVPLHSRSANVPANSTSTA